MDKLLLVNLISDQTIPNIQMIKEIRDHNENCHFLMITTESMEKKGIVSNIKTATGISAVSSIVVPEYSFETIKAKIVDFPYQDYDKIYVNLTGGTKVMSLAAFDFFKTLENAEINYIPGNSLDYIQLYPVSNNFVFNRKITLEEYLSGYGFRITETPCSGIPFNQTQKIFEKYCAGVFDNHKSELAILRENRKKNISGDKFDLISEFLYNIGYEPMEADKLSALEVDYLSGEWFEEYVGNKIKTELNLNDSDIMIGAKIFKNATRQNLNSTQTLINVDLGEEELENEIDVMFVFNNLFYVIECKTSIVNISKERKPKKKRNGEHLKDNDGNLIYEEKEKKINILGETIYKSDALKSKFGLFAKSYIFTLTDFVDYIDNDNSRKKQMISLINRASISNIKLIDKNRIVQSNSLRVLL